MSPEDLTIDEKSLLVECCDANSDFQQLIYDVHFTYPDLDIWQKYQIAFDLAITSMKKGVIEVLIVDYEFDENKRYWVPTIYTPVAVETMKTTLRHPMFWRSAYKQRLEISITTLGESILKQMMAN